MGEREYSFDIIGDIAVFETRERGRDGEIARKIMGIHSSVRRVFRKTGGRRGRYRLSKLRRVLGKPGPTLHTEHGYKLVIDPEKVYFSPRESTERQRIASQARPGERVLVMFSGAEPYSIAIAKKQPGIGKVYGIELNPAAERFALDSIRINKLSHKIVHITGDVRKRAEALIREGPSFHRVVMPLPETGHRFLGVAFRACRRGGTIHFYGISSEESPFRDVEARLKKAGFEHRVLSSRKVLPYAPRKWKVCLDVKKL
jgi:tRNA (guanine37-N1)-methyltransferase